MGLRILADLDAIAGPNLDAPKELSDRRLDVLTRVAEQCDKAGSIISTGGEDTLESVNEILTELGALSQETMEKSSSLWKNLSNSLVQFVNKASIFVGLASKAEVSIKIMSSTILDYKSAIKNVTSSSETAAVDSRSIGPG